MLKIKIPKGVEKLEIPMGIYVNGFIIKVEAEKEKKKGDRNKRDKRII